MQCLERDHVLRRACRFIADHRRRFERWLRLLEVKCNRCGRLSKADLRKVSALQTTPRFTRWNLNCAAKSAASRKNGSSARMSSALPAKAAPCRAAEALCWQMITVSAFADPLIALLAPGYFNRCSPTRRSRSPHTLSTEVEALTASHSLN